MEKKNSSWVKFSDSATWAFENLLPSAFSICLILTLIVYLLALLVTDHSALKLLTFWGDSLFNLNNFAFQMALILLGGSVIADSPFFRKMISKLVGLPQSSVGLVWMVFSLSCLFCLINWGLGLVASAFLAISSLKRVPQEKRAFILAVSYAGFLFWHGGLSGSVPLKLTDPGSLIKSILPEGKIELSETIFSSSNLILGLTLYLGLSLMFYFLSRFPLNPLAEKKKSTEQKLKTSLNAKYIFDQQYGMNLLLSLIILGYVGLNLFGGASLSFNLMILIFFSIALLFQSNISQFEQTLISSGKSVVGILFQFPFYAGIMGLIAKSGLGILMSENLLSWSTQNNFFQLTFLSAGIVNFFVPSGGGQWAIQGPIVLQAAQELNVSLAKASLALAYGDAWTNMIQPFWLLPLLSLSETKVSQIMYYLFPILIVSGMLVLITLFFV